MLLGGVCAVPAARLFAAAVRALRPCRRGVCESVLLAPALVLVLVLVLEQQQALPVRVVTTCTPARPHRL